MKLNLRGESRQLLGDLCVQEIIKPVDVAQLISAVLKWAKGGVSK